MDALGTRNGQINCMEQHYTYHSITHWIQINCMEQHYTYPSITHCNDYVRHTLEWSDKTPKCDIAKGN